jgi:AcrR family transcriptional regulator
VTIYQTSAKVKRSYRSPRRKAQAEATRTAIVKAGGELFARDGYAITSMKDIAREAGVAEPTVYATLGDKATIARAVAEAMASKIGDEAISKVDTAIVAEPSLTARAQLAARANVAAFVSSPVHLRDALAIGAASDPRLSEIVDELTLTGREITGRLVDLVAGAEQMQPAARARATDVVWAVSSTSVYRRLVESCGWALDEYVDWLAVEIERAVRGSDVRP